MNGKIIFAALLGVAAVGAVAYAIRRKTMKNKEERFEVIDSKMYMGDFKYKKIELKYYILDSVLTDVNNKVVKSPTKLLGPDWYDDYKLGFDINATASHIGTLYVRDHKWRRDIKVYPVIGSYIHEGHDIHDELFAIRTKKISEYAMNIVKGGK